MFCDIFKTSRRVSSQMPQVSSSRYVHHQACSQQLTGKYFWQFTFEQRSIAVAFLRRIYETCVKSAAGDNEAATAFVARFVRRTLREMTNQSTAPTRGASPAAEFDQAIVDQNLFDLVSVFAVPSRPQAEHQQNAWLPEPNILPDNPVLDDTYWYADFRNSGRYC
jgi:hypothetical protein